MKKIASILLATAGCALIFSCASTKNVAKETVQPTGDWELIHFEKSGVTRQIAVSMISSDEKPDKDSIFCIPFLSMIILTSFLL